MTKYGIMPKIAKKNQVVTHSLIAETAIQLAGSFYEDSAHDNIFYKYYPDLEFFIRKETGRFIPLAREYLAKLVGTNQITDALKEEIFEALMLDRGLPVQKMARIEVHNPVLH